MTTNLTVRIDESIKSKAQKKIKRDGLSMSVLIAQFLNAYVKEEIRLGFFPTNNNSQITASFDVSTEKGKKECLESFSTLCA